MQPSIPHVRILLVGNERIGKRSLQTSFIDEHILWRLGPYGPIYGPIQISDEFPDALFDTAEGMQPRAIGSLRRSIVVNATTPRDIWGFEDPRWPPTRAFRVEENYKSINPHVIGICFSVGDHKALDGVKDKV